MEGFLDSVYLYEVDSGSWTKLDATLPRKAHTVAAMMVDRSIFPSCGPPEPQYLMVLGSALVAFTSNVEVLSLDSERQLPYCLNDLSDLPFSMTGDIGAALSG